MDQFGRMPVCDLIHDPTALEFERLPSLLTFPKFRSPRAGDGVGIGAGARDIDQNTQSLQGFFSDLPVRCGKHQVRAQQVLYRKREQVDA